VSSYGWVNDPIELRFNGQTRSSAPAARSVNPRTPLLLPGQPVGPVAAPGRWLCRPGYTQVWFTGVHSDIAAVTPRQRRDSRDHLRVVAGRSRQTGIARRCPPRRDRAGSISPRVSSQICAARSAWDASSVAHGFLVVAARYFPRRKTALGPAPRQMGERDSRELPDPRDCKLRPTGNAAKVYTEEKWERYSPATAQAAPIHLMAVAETPEPLVRSQARR